jgi:adenosylmethionine-8-amino-7-oxononanoate aminotransferase
MQSAQMPSPDFRLAEKNETAEAYALRCAAALEQYVSKHSHELAAFIIEPLVQCAAGMGMYHPVYLRRAREICTKHNVHLIADEIAVGFGRTGSLFASYHDCDTTCTPDNCCKKQDCRPDFMCLSKGITGGYLPLSVVLTRDEIYQAFYDDNTIRGFLHSHSYTGNPLACSAALATLAIFETDHIIEKNKQKSQYLSLKMQAFSAEGSWHIQHMRHLGMITAFDVKTNNATFARDCYATALAQGLLLRPIGNTVYFMPPYTISESEIDFMVDVTLQALNKIL